MASLHRTDNNVADRRPPQGTDRQACAPDLFIRPDRQEKSMTDQTARQKAGNLNRESVADYLRENPDFFVDQDELLRGLTLPHDSGRAISLVERQVHLFREQRDTLRQ